MSILDDDAAKLMSNEWPAHRDQATDTNRLVKESHAFMSIVAENTKHLSKLDSLKIIEDKLLSAATSENKVDKDFVTRIIKILGFAVLLLVSVIVFLLTGEHFGLIGALKS